MQTLNYLQHRRVLGDIVSLEQLGGRLLMHHNVPCIGSTHGTISSPLRSASATHHHGILQNSCDERRRSNHTRIYYAPATYKRGT